MQQYITGVKPVKIVIDFDGTVVEHMYPNVGKDLPFAVLVLKMLVVSGHKLILSTMRSEEKYLDAAVKWFEEREIPLYGVQLDPDQSSWTSSPKAYGEYCIDDRNVGSFFTTDSRGSRCIDWIKVMKFFDNEGLFTDEAMSLMEDAINSR